MRYENGLSRRHFLAGAAGATLAATGGPLTGLASGAKRKQTSTPPLGTAWSNYMSGLVPGSAPAAAWAWVAGEQSDAGATGTIAADSSSTAVDTATCFELGSVTKVFTTLLLAYTAQQKGLALDTQIGSLLPHDPPCTNSTIDNTTLWELATYTNCIATHAPGQQSPSTTYADLVNFMNSSSSIVGNCSQQTTYYYSDFAVGLLGLCLGMIWNNDPTAWTTLIPQYITGPLGMPNTVRSPNQGLTPTAYGYKLLSSGKLAEQQPINDCPYIGGGGALVSTAADMLVFLQALIDPSTAPSDLQGPLETVQQPAAILDDQSGTGTTSVSLGWFLTRGGGKSNGMLSKNGGTNGFVSWIGFVPSQNKGLFGVVSRNKNAMWTQGAKYLRGELSRDRL